MIDTIKDYLFEQYDFILNNSNTTTLFVTGIIFIILYIFHLFKGKVYLFALISLPATLFHELMHFIVSLFTFGMPRKISIFPEKSDNGYTLGYVESYNVRWYNGLLIGLAPLLLIPIDFYFFKLYLINETNIYYILVKGYIAATLLEGSIPSITDIKLAISKSFYLFWIILALSYFYIKTPFQS